ncbi:MAG: hypothetical protein AB1Z55_06575 [Acidimicrobiia bacterium]
MGTIDDRLAAVEAELTAAAGDVSLCTISRSGGSVDGIKYLEGRMAALAEARRLTRHDPRLDPATIQSIASTWREQLVVVRERDAGRGWVAYRAGGVDELDDLLSDLGA